MLCHTLNISSPPCARNSTALGARECRTPADVDDVLKTARRRHDGRQFRLRLRGRQGAAGHRDGAQARQPARRRSRPCSPAPTSTPPTARAQLITGFAPSSPSIALFRDGKLVYMIERRDIEQRTAEGIADLLTLAFDKYCTTATTCVEIQLGVSKTPASITPAIPTGVEYGPRACRWLCLPGGSGPMTLPRVSPARARCAVGLIVAACVRSRSPGCR